MLDISVQGQCTRNEHLKLLEEATASGEQTTIFLKLMKNWRYCFATNIYKYFYKYLNKQTTPKYVKKRKYSSEIHMKWKEDKQYRQQ